MISSFERLLGWNELSANSDVWRATLAEFLGTMLLVLLGCASCIGADEKHGGSNLEIALTFGIVLAGLVQSLGHISGCHVNPAVTVATLLTAKISLFRAILYVGAQIVGSIAGAAVLHGLAKPSFKWNLGVTDVQDVTLAQGFGAEFFATFLLVLVIFAVLDQNRQDIQGSKALAIGLSLTAGILAAGDFTGGSLNPARSFGPAVITNLWDNHWIYWVGPIAGGATAAVLYQNFLQPQSSSVVDVDPAQSLQHRVLTTTDEKETTIDPTTMV